MRVTGLLSILILFMAVPCYAQDYGRTFERVVELNSKKPEQNPDYDQGSDILRWRILDRKNKVVGEIKDVILSNRGAVSFLKVDFDRLNLGQPVYINYRTMNTKPVSNGYALGFRDSQIVTLYPSLLADVETAAGGEDDQYSLQNLIGAKIKAEDGRSIGVVRDVMFAGRGERADALLVELKARSLRGKTVGVPFSAVQFSQGLLSFQGTMSTGQADAVINYAETR